LEELMLSADGAVLVAMATPLADVLERKTVNKLPQKHRLSHAPPMYVQTSQATWR
jgi:hypothetical protein